MNMRMQFNIIVLLSLKRNNTLADGWQLYKAGAFLHLLEDTANIRGRPTLVANCRALLLTRWR